MATPVLTYPEAVFKREWPGWDAFLGAKKAEPKKKAKKKKGGK